MCKQAFRYFRYVAKWLSLFFVLAGVTIFVIQFLPKEIGKAFWIFIAGGTLWAFDTLWDFLGDIREIADEINKHRQI